jgi:hypothetical protein
VREWSGGEWATGGGFQRGLKLILRNGELGLGWFSSDAIGRRGRCFWMAPCTDSREHVSGIGGWSVWPLLGRVQRPSGANDAWRCFYGAPDGWAGVASRRHHRAMQTCVKSRARRGAGARERHTRSGHAGRPARAMLAWTGRRAR